MTPDSSDQSQLALFIEMTNMASAYDQASADLLDGAAVEVILALLEAGGAIPCERRASLVAVGALMLRLGQNARADRAASTARMMRRLGISADDQSNPEMH